MGILALRWQYEWWVKVSFSSFAKSQIFAKKSVYVTI